MSTLWLIDYTVDGRARHVAFAHNAIADYRLLDPNATVREVPLATIESLIELACTFVANIDEWEGEPAPGMRWHTEYQAATALIRTLGQRA
ncbi:hypothetical protein [Pseudoxanthomonas mexicana]